MLCLVSGDDYYLEAPRPDRQEQEERVHEVSTQKNACGLKMCFCVVDVGPSGGIRHGGGCFLLRHEVAVP